MAVSMEMMRELFYRNPFNRYLGMEIEEIREGFVRGYIKIDERHRNVYDGMHGGCLYALADSVAGIASATHGHWVTTLSGTMNYLAAAKNSEYIYCDAQVVKAGRSIVVVDYKIYGDEGSDGKLFATGTYNYFALDQTFEKDGYSR